MKRLKPAGDCMRGLLSLKQIGTICFAFLFSVFSTNLYASGITATATSASCTNSTLETYSGTSNLQANWQANKVNLTWYSDDVKLDVQDAADFCNYDSVLNVPATQPTKTGYTFNGWTLRRIFVPEGYTQLEYIQSSGTQYINTGITLSGGDVFAMAVFEPTNLSSCSTYCTIFGRNSNFQAAYTSAGKAQIGNATSSSVFFALNTKVRVKATLSSSTAQPYYVDSMFTGLKRTFSSSLPLFLFASESSGTTYSATGKLYSFVAERNNAEIMHLYPAKRNSDSVIGMYDTVSGTFFTNAGSGTFTAGPVVQ